MGEEKDLKLVNIYIRIHNKQVLTMDDLAYLAQYNPVCFKKTCDNLIYEIPEAKELVKAPEDAGEPEIQQDIAANTEQTLFGISPEEMMQNEQMIMQVIENLKNIESSHVDILQSVDLNQVKDLLGNLFMENLFPHNGLQGYFDAMETEPGYTFDARA